LWLWLAGVAGRSDVLGRYGWARPHPRPAGGVRRAIGRHPAAAGAAACPARQRGPQLRLARRGEEERRLTAAGHTDQRRAAGHRRPAPVLAPDISTFGNTRREPDSQELNS